MIEHSTYLNYKYVTEDDHEEDNVKMWHHLFRPDGTEVRHEKINNYSPYRFVPYEVVVEVVEWDLIGD